MTRHIILLLIPLLQLATIVYSVAQIHATDTTKGYVKNKPAIQNRSLIRSYKQLRYEENYEFLKDKVNHTDYLDGLKYIAMGKGNSYLTIGGEVRYFYEHYTNESWGATEVKNNDYLLQRYMLHADLKLGQRVRFFTQLKSGLMNGRTGGARPVDVDKLDINQAFIDIDFKKTNTTDHVNRLMLRIGRQEIDFGAGRMISVRELPNVRAAYDGVRSTVGVKSWTFDAFAFRPAETNPGYFDDSTDDGSALWGLYSKHSFKNTFNMDVYYIGNTRDIAPFTHAVADEERHSVGARLWYAKDRWSWDAEGVYQAGSFGSAAIQAWGFSSRATYSLNTLKWRPKVSLNWGINSGDKNPGGSNNTFYPPAPNGAYFGAVGALGPGNVAGLAPKFSISPSKKVFIDTYCYFFWRQSDNDGTYNVPGFPSKTSTLSSARYIGTQAELDLVWQIANHQSLVFVVANFFSGKFIEETPPSKDIAYTALWYTFKF